YHEFGNSTLSGDLPNSDGTPLGDISEEMRIDPMAEFCSDVTRTNLVRTGTDTSQQVNSFFEHTLNFDALSHLDPVTMAGSRLNGQYNQLYQQAGGGFWKKLVGQAGISNLKDYTDAYHAALNANGGFFTSAQFQKFLNTYQFDGMPAGDWAAQNLPLIL